MTDPAVGPATQQLIAEGILDALNGEDPLGVLLRAHMFIEQDMNAIVAARVAYPDLLPRRPGFMVALKLVCAMGAVPADTLRFYERLNGLRNSMAHRLDFELTAAHQSELLDLIPPAFRDRFDGGHEPFPTGMRSILAWSAIQMRRARLRPPDSLLRRTAREDAAGAD